MLGVTNKSHVCVVSFCHFVSSTFSSIIRNLNLFVKLWYNTTMDPITRTRETIVAEIMEFARVNELQLHPGQDPLKHADLVIRKGGVCPCVPGRDHCPCQEALNDIAEIDRCQCGLFVNGAYVEEYSRLRGAGTAVQRPSSVEAKGSSR